ncbi:MAG: hypothetical protein M0Z65_09185 [Firmicutes bacterium]|uniref:Uncharacterized protein n=1 Tax=Kroppenstedtia guangzhouensis TaxID=1274356 RepID=A0ABQ1H3B8_9BACL|nr:hypothetical protein [Kroppenstedtia guangzhouensis]EGK10267.1 hypothetical protein HMPREF9374_2617 [Desmospora sp. 8437]MDA8353336.1 hypothetical protein [Bacillota bacterium]GGA57314.1 hypothetical protein GCM10007416_33170 [Kroppenstedtia guangzhouensis]
MMKKIMALAVVAFLALGGTAYAAHGDTDCCDQMTQKECKAMCKEMKKGSSECCEGMDCCDMEQGKMNMKNCMKMMKKQSTSISCC